MRLVLASIVLMISQCALAAPWIAITEIHYHPPGKAEDAAREEFIEILSREAPRADLSGWTMDGDVEFEFPEGFTILPGEYLIIAKDPQRIVELHPEAGRVVGPFSGSLDNSGGHITLRNASRGIACEAQFGVKGRWPASPDGTGHTLSILDPTLDPLKPSSWAQSRRIGGTPGAPNFPPEEERTKKIIPKGASWRYLKGLQAPASRWRDLAFDDSSWLTGSSGFGYGDNDDTTVLDDMSGSYMTLYTRHVFDVQRGGLPGRIVLRVDYDDAFVAYLNGKEVARSNLGAVGANTPPEQAADRRHEAGVPSDFDLGDTSKVLLEGRNVLAVEVHNDNLTSSDLTLIVELLGREASESKTELPNPLLNEIHAAGDASFIEIHNAGLGGVDLGGCWITDDPSHLMKLRISGPARLDARGRLVLTRKELGDKIALERTTGFFALTAATGDRVIDAIQISARKDLPPELAAKPRGRFPEGSSEIAVLEAPTPGSVNRMRQVDSLVINEILYHSITNSEDDEFVEIFNRSSSPVDLKGFRMTGAVRLEFPEKASIRAGGHIVVARSPTALAARHVLAREIVFGPYEGSLSARADEIVLRDDLGNVADRVAYADRDPWPRWADGLGSSLELMDPALDNSIPQSWAASDASAQSRWESISFKKKHRDFQGRNFSELQFILLDAGECMIDDVQVSGGVLAETFERGASGWSALGNHEASGISLKDAAQGKAAYRIVSGGRGNPRHNYVSRSVDRGLVPSREYVVKLRARWIRGSPDLLIRTPGQGLALVHHFQVPARLGTPGAENSRRSRKPPPAVDTPRQTPVVPAVGEPVTISVRISAASAISTAFVYFKPRGAPKWTGLALSDDGVGRDLVAADGVWTGQIPGVTAPDVAFYVVVTDVEGGESTFPVGAPGLNAMYAVGTRPAAKFPSYTILVPDAEWQALSDRPRMSNQPLNATLIQDDSRILYNVGLRPRGSPFTRSQSNWRVIFGAENLDGRSTLTLDGQGGDGTRPSERLTYWLADQLHAPNSRQAYVHVRIVGREEGIYEDVEKVDARFLRSWFPPAAEQKVAEKKSAGKEKSGAEKSPSRSQGTGDRPVGLLHKVDDFWELSTSGEQIYREAELAFDSTDPEDYRWNFPPRGNSLDLEPLVKLLKHLDPQRTPDKTFDAGSPKLLDSDEWVRVLAARAMADDWDTMGRTRGKNAFLYLPPEDHRWRLIPWDCDLAWQQNAHAPLQTGRFGSIERLLERPENQRRYLAYLAYLAERSLDPARFELVLGDLKARSGSDPRSFRNFANARQRYVLSQIPAGSFRVSEFRRVERAEPYDIVRASGVAPVRALRFRLNGKEGTGTLTGADRWTAEFPVGPDGGAWKLEALDFGGVAIAEATVKIQGRSGAKPLPAAKAEAIQLTGQGKTAGAVSIAPAATGNGQDREEPRATLGEIEVEGMRPAVPVVKPSPENRLDRGARPPVEAKPAIRAMGPRPAERLGVTPTKTPGPRANPPPTAIPQERHLPWATLIAGVIGLGVVQLGVFALLKRRPRAEARSLPQADGVPDQPRTGSRELIQRLGSDQFSEAEPALGAILDLGERAIPDLIASLGDYRPTPFAKVRRVANGLSALRAEGPSPIQVRHVAAVMLQRLLGKPPHDPPTAVDWEAWWRDPLRPQRNAAARPRKPEGC